MPSDEHLLFGPVSPENLRILTRTAEILLRNILARDPSRQAESLENLERFSGDTEPEEQISAEVLERALAATRGKFKDAQLAALLAQRVRPPHDRMTGNALTAWVVGAVLARKQIDPAENTLDASMRHMRLLKSRDAVHLALIAPLPETLEEVVRHLRTVMNRPETPPGIRDRLASIHHLLFSWSRNKLPIHRRGSLDRRVRQIRTDQDLVAELSGGFIAKDPAIFGAPEEQEADMPHAARAITLPRGVDTPGIILPGPAMRSRTRQIARAQARRNLALSSENDLLTDHECVTLVSEAQGRAGDATWDLLLAMLCYGLPWERLTDTAIPWSQRNQQSGIVMHTDLPDPEILIELRAPAAVTGLFLTAPPALKGDFSWSEITREMLAAALTVVRPRLARPLTLNRISRFKADWLRRAGADAAIIGFLIGRSPASQAQMHYTALRHSQAQHWHRRYLREALGLQDVVQPMDQDWLGSGIRLHPEALPLLFEEQRRELSRRAIGSVAAMADIARAHEAFALYTLMVLYLATGHRPVSAPFERLSDFDPETGLLWILDKETAGGRGSRIVMLPPTARRQMQLWCAHLERLGKALLLPRPEVVRERIMPALQSSAPLFFLLKPDGKVREMTAAVQSEALRDVFPLPLNWPRHILRSALVARKAVSQVIDAAFGHGHLGENGFGPGSGLSIDDLRILSRQVEELLQSWGVIEVGSPLCP